MPDLLKMISLTGETAAEVCNHCHSRRVLIRRIAKAQNLSGLLAEPGKYCGKDRYGFGFSVLVDYARFGIIFVFNSIGFVSKTQLSQDITQLIQIQAKVFRIDPDVLANGSSSARFLL